MFKAAFNMALISLQKDDIFINACWDEIQQKYQSNGRHYHTINHLHFIIEVLSPVKEQIKDWQTIVFSVAYHDIIYNVLKKDNEEKSAAFAEKKLKEFGCRQEQIEACTRQIIGTKTHQLSDDPDTNFFIDADLAILGTEPNTYLEYKKNIRKEYRYFPDILYNKGRKKVLTHFLQMPQIFKTPHFQNLYETQARFNLKAELFKVDLSH